METKLAVPYVQPGDVVYVLRTWQADLQNDLNLARDALRTLILGERLIRGAGSLDIVIGA